MEAGGLISCYATGDVVSTDRFGISTAGGFIGYNGYGNSYPINCYATGDVSGFNNVGGFCGTFNSDGAINCYASGKVTSVVDGGAGGFAGLLWRYFNGAVQFINCSYDKDASGVSKAMGEIEDTVSKPSTVKWVYPIENYPLYDNVRALTTQEMQSEMTFKQTNEKYNYAAYEGSNTPQGLHVYCTDWEFPWDFQNVWAINEGNSTPYLKNIDGAQLLKLSASNHNLGVGDETTVTLDGYAGMKDSDTITWSIDGGEKISETDQSVTIKATSDDIIRVNAIINGVKQDSIKLLAGTGGEKGMEAIFVTPAPTKDGRAYNINIRPEFKISFTHALNVEEFMGLTKPLSLIPMTGGVGAVEDLNLSYEFSQNNTLLTVKLDKDLSHGVRYNLTLADGLKGEDGASLVGNKAIEFQTYSFENPKVTLHQSETIVDNINAGKKYTLNAEFTNHVPTGEDMGVAYEQANVYMVVRGGMGARETYGGDILLSKELELNVATNDTQKLICEFEVPAELEGNVYVDVYTWSKEKSYAKAMPTHITYRIAE